MQLDNEIAHAEVTQGKYRVSIGTSLALEVLFGINDNVPPTNPLPYTNYQYLIINLRTLIRNLYGAVAKELKTEWKASKYLEKITEELEVIPEIIDSQSHGKLVVGVYSCSYRSVGKKYPKAIMRRTQQNAFGKQHYEAIEQYCVAQLSARALRGELPIHLLDVDIPNPNDRASVLVMTHLPIDLLSFTESKTVDLLESHTGTIKDRYKWYTKFATKNLARIPFSAWSLQWFGDGKYFAPFPPKYRAMVVDFADKNKWNQSTSDRLIKTQVARLPDPEIRKSLASLL